MNTTDIVGLLIASLGGAAVGLERQWSGHAEGPAARFAGIRTFAMLGVHGCVAVAAVTVQNTVGVKGFHEIPLDVIAGQIEAVVDDIGIQAAKTGMLASSDIITTVAETWRGLSADGPVAPLVVDPVCASMHGDPLLHPSALKALRAELFPIATLVTPNLDEVRLIVEIEVIDSASQHDPERNWSVDLVGSTHIRLLDVEGGENHIKHGASHQEIKNGY